MVTTNNSRDSFKANLCKEVSIPYTTAIGESEDIVVLEIKGTDIDAKNRIKAWFKKHPDWIFVSNDDRHIELVAGMPQCGYIHEQVVTYRHRNSNHKIVINILHDN